MRNGSQLPKKCRMKRERLFSNDVNEVQYFSSWTWSASVGYGMWTRDISQWCCSMQQNPLLSVQSHSSEHDFMFVAKRSISCHQSVHIRSIRYDRSLDILDVALYDNDHLYSSHYRRQQTRQELGRLYQSNSNDFILQGESDKSLIYISV